MSACIFMVVYVSEKEAKEIGTFMCFCLDIDVCGCIYLEQPTYLFHWSVYVWMNCGWFPCKWIAIETESLFFVVCNTDPSGF